MRSCFRLCSEGDKTAIIPFVNQTNVLDLRIKYWPGFMEIIGYNRRNLLSVPGLICYLSWRAHTAEMAMPPDLYRRSANADPALRRQLTIPRGNVNGGQKPRYETNQLLIGCLVSTRLPLEIARRHHSLKKNNVNIFSCIPAFILFFNPFAPLTQPCYGGTHG